jgi:ABC-type molybdenum transport system ATPase subunit/photorepair protein PhrA
LLSRVYVDNYRSLVNFELKLGREQLLLGRNGAGKTTLFDAVDAVVRFARGESTIEALFPSESKTRWDSRKEQTFELDLTSPSGESGRYRLVIELRSGRHTHAVAEESVHWGGSPLLLCNDAQAQLYGDDGSAGPNLLTDGSRSSLPAIHDRATNKKLTAVKRRLGRIRVVSPDPRRMVALSEREDTAPLRDLSNLASWYRHLHQEDSERTERMRDRLRAILDGFHTLDLKTEGASRRLTSRWRAGAGSDAKTMEFTLDELSDGQRVLLALSMLAAEPDGEEMTLLLDEPDNFVALAEVQPLLMAMRMRPELQLLVISHHPEIINLQAREHGLVFERQGLGPTRVRPFTADEQSSLTPAEIIARGEE